MAKTIRKTIQITTRKRHNGVKINEEFYSYDKNNAQFEFIMDYDIPADKVIALFHFENTNRYYETLCQFKGNLITIEFDTSLIVEDELVTGYLYFDKLEKSTDVYRFTFGARLSEIDKTRELPVEEKVSRRIVPVADIVTKQELEELMDKIKKNGGTYDDTEIRELLSGKADSRDVVTKQELDTKGYLTEHQSLEEYAKKTELYNDSALVSRVAALENKTDNDTVYNDTEVKERLTNLENKAPVDLSNLATKEELNDVRNNQPVVDTSNLVTKNELEKKGYLTAHQSLDEYAKKSEIPQGLEDRVSLLETKSIANGAYNDKPLLDKIREVEEQFRNASNLYLTSHQSLEHLVTKDELNNKGYLTAHQDISNLATNSKVEAVEQRVQVLENKPDVDLSHVVTKDELASKNYLTAHQDISGLATKQELEVAKASIPQPYNDTEIRGQLARKVDKDTLATLATKQELQTNDEEIKRRLSNLEGKTDNFISGVSVNKEGSNVTLTYNYVDGQTKNVSFTDSDTVNVAYDDSGLKARLTNLENRPQSSGNNPELLKRIEKLENRYINTFTPSEANRRLTELTGEATVNSDELVTKTFLNSQGYLTSNALESINRTVGEQNTKISTLQAKLDYEIHGTGMPNGVVEAPIGTTYIDKDKTNGALKWIKTTDGGNEGWKVVEGDTGWLTVFKKDEENNKNTLKLRRVNNMVNVLFYGDLAGNDSIFLKKITDNEENLALVSIASGFKPETAILLTALNDFHDIARTGVESIGVCRFDIVENMLTVDLVANNTAAGISSGINKLNFTYSTYEEWPTELPTL